MGKPTPAVDVPRADRPLFAGPVAKSDLAGYYRSVADRMLPQLADRPLAMERYRNHVRVITRRGLGYLGNSVH